MRLSLLALIAVFPTAAHAQITWTGASSNDIFDEVNWDLSLSAVTTIDPQGGTSVMSIDDDVIIANVTGAGAPTVLNLAGGQFRFQVAGGRSITVDNAEVNLEGGSNDGFGSEPGSTGLAIQVRNGSVFHTFFVVNNVAVDIDATSRVRLDGGGNPVNLSTINMTGGSVLEFGAETPAQFLAEHLSKCTVNGVPALDGVNIDVVSDGASGCIVTVIPQALGTNYCVAASNSTGSAAGISATGSSVVSDNDLTLVGSNLPLNSFTVCLVSDSFDYVVGSGGSTGNLCLGAFGRGVGGQIYNSGATGSVSAVADLTALPHPSLGFVAVQPGERWNFQFWFRDAVGGATTSNFTDAISVTFE